MSYGISVYIDNIHVIKRASLLSPNRKNAKFFKNGLNATSAPVQFVYMYRINVPYRYMGLSWEQG